MNDKLFLNDNNKLDIYIIEQNKQNIDWNSFTYYYSDYLTPDILKLYNHYLNYNILFNKLNDNKLKELFGNITYDINKINFNFISIFHIYIIYNDYQNKSLKYNGELLIDIISWYDISSFQLSEIFIEKYKDKVNWKHISQYQKLSEEFIEKYKYKVCWYIISRYQKLNEKFIEKFHDKVCWINISIHQKLSENFIEKNHDKVDWWYISIYQKLSETFIEKFQDKVNWYNILKYQNIDKNILNNLYDNYIHSDLNILFQ